MSDQQKPTSALAKFTRAAGRAISAVATPVIDTVQQSVAYSVAVNTRDLAVAVSDSHGAAPIWAGWRGGLKDLQDAVLTPFPDSMKAREEVGSIASPPMAAVDRQMTGKAREVEMER